MLSPQTLTPRPNVVSAVRHELMGCALSPHYFIANYCKIYDPTERRWIPFRLWTAQVRLLALFQQMQKTIVLKARQVGVTWVALGYALWQMLFRPIAEVLLFSRREEEAVYLLGNERLRGMYKQLPTWMQARSITVDGAKHLRLSNGSGARAFPSNAGDSYTATLAVVDEADLVPDLGDLMRSVSPTVETGGKLLLVSRSDKEQPQSHFKAIYRAAKQTLNDFAPYFIPWWEHPDRDEAWYKRQCADAMANEGSLDSVYQNYPATDAEALAPKILGKRFAPAKLLMCYDERAPLLDLLDAPAINGLRIYELPQADRKYAIGADTAEGNPDSDDSAAVVKDCLTGASVAVLQGKFEPFVLGGHLSSLSRFYHKAPVLVERNNHGHSVVLWLRDNAYNVRRLTGLDGKDGWLTTSPSKIRMYDDYALALREGTTTVYDFATYTQLASIQGATLNAPDQEHDDLAVAEALAHLAVLAASTQRYHSATV